MEYRNPVNDMLHIALDSEMAYEKAVLYTIDGRLIEHYTVTGETLTVNMKDIRAGLYYMVFVNNRTEDRQMVRIFKQ